MAKGGSSLGSFSRPHHRVLTGGISVDIGERQRKLSLWAVQRLTEPEQGLFASKRDLRLYDLYHLVYEPTWLRAAHERVARNSGSKTAGCDGITMSTFDADLEENLRKLAEDLRTERFEPHPVRRVYIPKKNGKLRPLGVPSIRDRIVQESLRMILEPIFEAEFYDLSFGFRPNRSTIDALATILHRASNKGLYHWVIEGDIKSCFDKIHHRKLIQLLRSRIRDEKLLRLVWRFLRAGVMEKALFAATQEGTPQGGVVSPLLANVYLHELDRYLERRTSWSPAVRRQRRREGRANFVHIRYADDFVVMCNGTRAEAEAMKRDLQEFLSSELKLTLSEEKTQITHVNDGFPVPGVRHPTGDDRLGDQAAQALDPHRCRAEVPCEGACHHRPVHLQSIDRREADRPEPLSAGLGQLLPLRL
jgi:RNA-directed DNA polymerase